MDSCGLGFAVSLGYYYYFLLGCLFWFSLCMVGGSHIWGIMGSASYMVGGVIVE